MLFSQAGAVVGAVEPDDLFGSAAAVGDFNADGFDDLAIGAPGEDIRSATDTGVVHVLYGSTAGLDTTNNQLLSQLGPLWGKAETNDRFGASLAVADFDRDGFDDLVVGAPGESFGSGALQAGLVHVLSGSADGISPEGQQIVSQAGEYPDQPETGDGLGYALAAGDTDADGFPDLVIGVPGEDFDTGAVLTVKGTAAGFTTVGSYHLVQGAGLTGAPEQGDRVGASIAVGDVDADLRADLVIGAPGESLGEITNAGLVHVVPGTYVGPQGYGGWSFTRTDLGQTPAINDEFGTSVVVGRFDNQAGLDLVTSGPLSVVLGVNAMAPPPPALGLDPSFEAVTWYAQRAQNSGYEVTISVFGANEGEIYSFGGDNRMLPASNQKVITAMGAFELLDPEFRFVTRVGVDRQRNLIIEAGGDPTLTTAGLAELAKQVADTIEVKRINRVIVDNTRYDQSRLNPGVAPGNLPTWTGPLSAFMVNDNRWRTDASYLSYPEIGNAELLVSQLEDLGVTVVGPATIGVVPVSTEFVAEISSPKRDDLLLRMLLFSDNEIADQLVREIGYRYTSRGSTLQGKQVISKQLEQFGVTLAVGGDGSGLSYTNDVSARDFTALLEGSRGAEWFGTFYYSLPIGGVSGTLGGRLGGPFTAGKVRAKTGSLFTSRALSGFTDSSDVRLITFSVMINGTNSRTQVATIDEIVTILSGLG